MLIDGTWSLETNEVKARLRLIRAIRKGHFVFNEGDHNDTYINKDVLYANPRHAARVAELLAEPFIGDGVEVIVAPAIGGVVLANRAAEYLMGKQVDGPPVYAVFADKSAEGFVIRRGYDEYVRGKRVLILEDTTTTGRSIRRVFAAVESVNGKVIGLGLIWNRGGVSFDDLKVKINSLVNEKLPSWSAADCPLCKSGVPINVELGHGAEFLSEKSSSRAT